MAESRRNLAQISLNPKLGLFLESLNEGRPEEEKESLPPWVIEGLCNAYVFMHWRAEMGGESSKHLERLDSIADADAVQIIGWGKLYKDYQDIYRDEALKKKIDQNIEDRVFERLKSNYHYDDDLKAKQLLKDLEFVKELYVFIHSLLAAHNARLHLGIQEAGQSEFGWMMKYFLPIDTLELDKIKETSPLDLPFIPYTNTLLQEQLDKLMQPGDVVMVNHGGHVFKLNKESDGTFSVADSQAGQGIIRDIASSEEVVNFIQEIYFPNSSEPDASLMLKLTFLARPDGKELPRPDRFQVVEELMVKGLDLNARSTVVDEKMAGKTVLMFSIESVSPDYPMIEWLLKKGVDVNIPDASGLSPLHCAVMKQDKGVINALLEKNPNLMAKMATGETSLIIATMMGGDLSILQLLLSRKEGLASLNEVDNSGNSAVHWAAAMGNGDALKILIENGADLSIHNKFGLGDESSPLNPATPLDLAIQGNHWHCVLSLLMAQKEIPEETGAMLNNAEIKQEIMGQFDSFIQTVPEAQRSSIIDSVIHRENALGQLFIVPETSAKVGGIFVSESEAIIKKFQGLLAASDSKVQKFDK